MNQARVLAAVTALNLGLLVFLLSQVRPVQAARAQEQVLRGRALEIVDDQGRVRASIKVQPGGTHAGEATPEVVILRLVDRHGRPGVKLSTAQEGGTGLLLLTRSDESFIRLDAEGPEPAIAMQAGAGRQKLVKP